MNKMRIEHDSIGTVSVARKRLWGAQTQRSLTHFKISTERMPSEIILALVAIKKACAKVNGDLGLLPDTKAKAIMLAADEILSGRHQREFSLSVWQTGSGTHSNMNVNEVLANRSSELLHGERGAKRCVHPNDEVNLGQSSNDVFPTAMHVSAVHGIVHNLLPALASLHCVLSEKSQAFAHLTKIGRTHLQDATPLTLGQEFSGYAAQLGQAHTLISQGLNSLYPLAIGGTAVGTGLNTHPEFGKRVANELAQRHQLPFTTAPNKFSKLAAHDNLVAMHGLLKTLAVALMKIANDVRWLASGPRCGLGEISLPENEPGSSMMPGKVNPSQCEALTMLCCQVMANDVAISLGGALGNFELNVYKPLIAHNLLQSIRLLSDGMRSFETYCARGIEARPARIAELLEKSLMLVTVLVPHVGYDHAAEIAHKAHIDNSTLRAATLSLGYLTAEVFDQLMNSALLPPHLSGEAAHETNTT